MNESSSVGGRTEEYFGLALPVLSLAYFKGEDRVLMLNDQIIRTRG
jgi:hypothetical protein